MNVTYRVSADAGQLTLLATGEIPFVPNVGMHLRVFDGAELEEVSFVSWSATEPDWIDVWFASDVAPEDIALFIRQGWKVETHPTVADVATGDDSRSAAPIDVPRMAA